MSRLYVGRINYRAREKDIERFFRGFGPIKEVMLKNGYGFVDFEDPRDAEDAMYELNGRELLGDRIVIEYAKGTPHGRDAHKDRFRSSERHRGDYYPSERDKKSPSPRRSRSYKVTVEPISSRALKSDIKSHFRKCGDIDRIEIKGNSAHLSFLRSKDAKYCVDKFDGTEFFDKKIIVEEERSRSRSPRKSRSRHRSRESKSRSKDKSSYKSSRNDSKSKSKSPPSLKNDGRKESDKNNNSRSSEETSPQRRKAKATKTYDSDEEASADRKHRRTDHSDDDRRRHSSESARRSRENDTSKDRDHDKDEFENKCSIENTDARKNSYDDSEKREEYFEEREQNNSMEEDGKNRNEEDVDEPTRQIYSNDKDDSDYEY